MSVAQTYRKAVNTLKPNAKRMALIRAAQAELTAAATIIVNARMKSGKSAMELYKESYAEKCDNESELDRQVRVLLLGKARRG